MKLKIKYLCVLFALFIIIAVLPRVVSAAPIVWYQSNVAFFTNFNGCVDNNQTPNPIQTKNMPINFISPVPSGHQIFVFVSAINNVSSPGGCVGLGPSPWISSVTDNAGSTYTYFNTYIGSSTGTPFVNWEIWSTTSSGPNAQNIMVNTAAGKRDISGIAYDFSGIVTKELFTGAANGLPGVVSGEVPFSVTWNNTAQVVLPLFFTNSGLCTPNFPACVAPATATNAQQGGYNENNITVACIGVGNPPTGGCPTNNNGKSYGGDNHTALTIPSRIQTARITSITTGSHTFFWHTDSPQMTSAWVFGLLLSPQVNPTVNTLPADNIGIDSARLNGNITDLGISATINVWFIWGDTTGLGNNTSAQPTSTIGAFSQTIYQLFSNHTYYFKAHAENAANGAFANGSMLNFTTAVNNNLVNFIAYGWVFGFLAALILGLMGAYWIKKKRDEH